MKNQIFKLFCSIIFILCFFIFAGWRSKNEEYLEVNCHTFKLKEMFSRMVEQKNASLIPEYYHKDFLLETNGQKISYDAFLEMHQTYYKSPIQYKISYDEETFVEHGHKIAGRVWITTKLPNESPKKIEVILIVEYKEGKIYRLWELTYPDWSKIPVFNF